jgi:hypothetical protein
MEHMGFPLDFPVGKTKTARTSQCGPSWELECFLALRPIVDPLEGGPVVVVIAIGGGEAHGPTLNAHPHPMQAHPARAPRIA